MLRAADSGALHEIALMPCQCTLEACVLPMTHPPAPRLRPPLTLLLLPTLLQCNALMLVLYTRALRFNSSLACTAATT